MARLKIGFCFITDETLTKYGITEDAKEAILGGATMIQLRKKAGSPEELLSDARTLKELTGKHGIPLIINDRPEICVASGADGVHVGQNDMPARLARQAVDGKILGVSARNADEALAAERDGADYLGVGPIFATATKKDAGDAIGLAALEDIHGKTSLPIIAIGGITLKNAPSVLEAGADGICAISATSGEGVRGKVRQFADLFSRL